MYFLDKKDSTIYKDIKPYMKQWEYVNDDIDGLCDADKIENNKDFIATAWSGSFNILINDVSHELAIYYIPAEKYILIKKI